MDHQASLDPHTLGGIWHLLDEHADETRLPQHRMDVLVRCDGAALRGAVLSRVTGQEMQVIDRIWLEGDVLRLQLKPGADAAQAARMVLVMVARAGRFIGGWEHDGEPVGPPLKLVRHVGAVALV